MANCKGCNLPQSQCTCSVATINLPVNTTTAYPNSGYYTSVCYCTVCGHSPCTCYNSFPAHQHYNTTSTNAYTWPFTTPNNFKGRIIHQLEGYTGPDIINITEATCSKCKQIKPIFDIAFSYGYIKIARHICSHCYIKLMDKKFELEPSSLEETLFK